MAEVENSLASYSYSYLMEEYNIAQNMKYEKEVQDEQWYLAL